MEGTSKLLNSEDSNINRKLRKTGAYISKQYALIYCIYIEWRLTKYLYIDKNLTFVVICYFPAIFHWPHFYSSFCQCETMKL